MCCRTPSSGSNNGEADTPFPNGHVRNYCRFEPTAIPSDSRQTRLITDAFGFSGRLSWHQPRWARPHPAAKWWIVFHNRLAAPVAWEPDVADQPMRVLALADHRPFLVRWFGRHSGEGDADVEGRQPGGRARTRQGVVEPCVPCGWTVSWCGRPKLLLGCRPRPVRGFQPYLDSVVLPRVIDAALVVGWQRGGTRCPTRQVRRST